MKHAARTALLTAFLAALAGPVCANAISTATFGNVTIKLVDLNPNDGIAPSISFLPYANRYEGGAYIYGEAETGQTRSWQPGSQLSTYEKNGSRQSTNVSDSVHVDMASSAASVTGSADGLGFTALSISGSAESEVGGYGRYQAFASVPVSPNSKRFILSANTMVSFSIDASLSASMTLGYTDGALEGEAAYALLMMYAGGVGADGSSLGGDLQEHSTNVYYLDNGGPPAGASESWSGTMTSSFSNLNNFSSLGEFYAAGTVGGHSVALAAVPEPATSLTFLSGLGLMGALARRRRTRSE